MIKNNSFFSSHVYSPVLVLGTGGGGGKNVQNITTSSILHS